MSDTPNIGFPLLEQAQAQKEVTVNETLVILDALLGGVISQSTTAPPGSPAEGDAYIVPVGASGVWVGHVEDIAYFFGGVWNFLPPSVGVGHEVWVRDDAEFVQYSEASPQAWSPVGGAAVTSVNGDTGAVVLNAGYVGEKGADIASAGTTNLATATGDFVDVTGTTTITALGTAAAGVERLVRFTGALLLTHNGTSLILPTGANITTAAGDTALFISLGSGNWVCVSYQRKSGAALVSSSTAGKHAIWVAAGSITPSATGGCAALATIASAANQPDIQTLDFDATTQEYAQFSIRMPKSWNEGTVTFSATWSHAATVTNFGVVWDLQAVAMSDDDTILANYGTAQTSTDTGGTTSDIYLSPESSAITVGGTPAAEDMVFYRLSRVTGNGSDTMTIDARLHGITLYITTDAENDA